MITERGGIIMVNIFVTVVSVVEFNGLTGICIIVMYFNVWLMSYIALVEREFMLST